jgi:hypothetical protein
MVARHPIQIRRHEAARSICVFNLELIQIRRNGLRVNRPILFFFWIPDVVLPKRSAAIAVRVES